MSTDPDESAPWVTGQYDDPRARLIWLDRQRRIRDGWELKGLAARVGMLRSTDPPPAATMTGDTARDIQEMRDWLALQAAIGALIDVEIEHGDL